MTHIYAHGATTPVLAKMPTYILKTASSTNVPQNWPVSSISIYRRMKFHLFLSSCNKNQLQMKDLNASPKTQTVREEGRSNTSRCRHGQQLLEKDANCSGNNANSWETQFHYFKGVCIVSPQRFLLNGKSLQPHTSQRKSTKNSTPQKRSYKESKNPVNKWAKEKNSQFSKKMKPKWPKTWKNIQFY